jgi:hypothetical protein
MFSASWKKGLATAMAGAALASALVVSGASGYPQDLRSSDGVDEARVASSIATSAGDGYQDLRSPDTRDQAEGYGPARASQPVADQPSRSDGFDLPSAAIGAAAGTGLVIVLLAVGALSRRRPLRRRHGAVRA